jgi:cytidine deaminase
VEAGLVRGVLPSERVAQVLAESGYRLEQLMMALLPVAAGHAHTPVSHYPVGAVALGMPATGRGPGSLYLGANFEFESQVLCFSIHAEQSAANNAWLNRELGIRTIAVTAAPCGLCRQFLTELTTQEEALRVITSETTAGDDAYEAHALSGLLPSAFGPDDLGVQGGLMQAENHELALENTDPLVQTALSACNSCYAPYTKAYAGVALRGADDKIYAGQYAENAAYNPSLLAIQSALAFMTMQTGPAAGLTILDAVLVERAAGRTSQREATRLMLESISPGTELRCHAV